MPVLFANAHESRDHITLQLASAKIGTTKHATLRSWRPQGEATLFLYWALTQLSEPVSFTEMSLINMCSCAPSAVPR